MIANIRWWWIGLKFRILERLGLFETIFIHVPGH